MEARTRLLEKVNFTVNKVDVSAAVANQRLLDGYLGLRTLSPMYKAATLLIKCAR